VFVVTGDHGLSIVPYGRKIQTLAGLTELRHRVPLILYSPLLEARKVPGPASHADIPETLLGLAGIGLPRSGVGRDLLDTENYDPSRPILMWSAPARLVTLVDATRMYMASLQIDPSPREPIRLSEEALVDPVADPGGNENRLQDEPRAAARYRQLVRIYAEVYPWLIFSGRSGVPQSSVPLTTAAAR
jgi:arylsulfatase A-like enzyme